MLLADDNALPEPRSRRAATQHGPAHDAPTQGQRALICAACASVITKDDLLKRGWPRAEFQQARLVDSALTDLNHQLCAQGARRLFENVSGVGWRLAADVDVDAGERT